MRDSVLWRKQSRIIMLLAEKLSITSEQALDLYYKSNVSRQLPDPRTGLQLMSDQYIIEDLLAEIEN